MRTINHSSTVINPRGSVVACCFAWNLLVRTMRPSFSGEASLGLAQGNREEGLLSKEARLAVRSAVRRARDETGGVYGSVKADTITHPYSTELLGC